MLFVKDTPCSRSVLVFLRELELKRPPPYNRGVMSFERNRPVQDNSRVRDAANPYCGNCNEASYQLLDEMRALGILTAEYACRGMYSGYLGGVLHWIDLRPIKLVLRGAHKIYQGICIGVNEELSGSDIALILDTAREIAQRDGLRVYIHRNVGRPNETEEMELDKYLKGYTQAEVDIPIPDLIGFKKNSSSLHVNDRCN